MVQFLCLCLGLVWGLQPMLLQVEPSGDSLRTQLNRQRAERGLAALRSHELLDRAAILLAGEIAGSEDGDRQIALAGDLILFLEKLGYDARFAAKSVHWGSTAPATILDTWLEQEDRGWSHAFSPVIGEIGLGWHGRGQTQVVVAIFALSRGDSFLRETSGLGDLETVYGEMLDAVNEAREKKRVGRLLLDSLLTHAAQDYADAMLAHSFYGHESPEGSDVGQRIEETGYRLEMAAENLAEGPTSVAEVISAWIDSRHHRDNLLDSRFQDTGFGLAFGKNENGWQILWVQCLARPRRR